MLITGHGGRRVQYGEFGFTLGIGRVGAVAACRTSLPIRRGWLSAAFKVVLASADSSIDVGGNREVLGGETVPMNPRANLTACV